MRLKLPIGLSDFRGLIEDGYQYIDKTMYLYKLCTEGKYYFLSHPRRFGKSLMLSTLQEMYLGRKELFKGLWIENRWNWDKKHPVIKLSLKTLSFRFCGLIPSLADALDDLAQAHGVVLTHADPKGKFGELLQRLHAREGKVVVLIDEYDAPILDYLGEDMAQVLENRAILREFYTVLKEQDAILELVLLTGVSKFSKVGVFSGLNNLHDISMAPGYATLLGYTQQELEENFVERIEETADYQKISKDELLAKIRYWYNGYRFAEDEPTVYNPWSVQEFFSFGRFKNFWFTTGTPTFLINLMRSTGVFRIPDEPVEESTFSTFEPETLSAETLLYQAGYLTIKERLPNGLYLLDFPNYEVHESLNKYLFPAFSGTQLGYAVPFYFKIRDAFAAHDLERVMDLLTTLYEGIPHELYANLPRREAFYHATLHLIFDYIGLMVRSEEPTAIGRADTIVETPTHVYVLEFKLDQSPEAALAQIQQRGYYRKFLNRGRAVVLVGVNFSSETKNLAGWKTEEVG